MAKLAFIDVETTGTDERKNGIIQLACILEVDGEVVSEMDWHMQPLPGDEIVEKALEVNGLTRRDLAGFPSAAEIHRSFKAELNRWVDKYAKHDKFFFLGYNGGFDYRFCRAWFEKLGDKYFGSYFCYPAIDVMGQLAAANMDIWLSLPDRKLLSVYQRFCPDKAETFQAHDALADIRATIDLWRIACGEEVIDA